MSVFKLMPMGMPDAPDSQCEYALTAWDYPFRNIEPAMFNAHDHTMDADMSGDVVAVHPLDDAFPHPEGTLTATEYVRRTLAMAAHPSAADAPESPREAWCTWYGCMTVAAPARCVHCGDFHPRGIPSPDVRAYA